MKRIAFIVLCSTLLLGCKKLTLDSTSTTHIIGHGGMGYTSQYPINSLESILNALALGADGVEIDVQLTKDGQLVAFHNRKMEENTNKSGFINDHTWEELRNARYRDLPYASYRIYRLVDILNAIPNPNEKYLFIDCKMFTHNSSEAYYNAYNSALLSIIEQYHLKDKFVIETGSLDMIYALHHIKNDLELYYYVNNPAEALQIENNEIVTGIMFRQEDYSKEDIAQLKAKGLKTAAWSVINKNDLKTAAEKGIDFAQVDNLRKLLK